MIDAYEIGIQLLLQEDVSAGLAVINGGLAEVDRAIAATSADLVGLVQKAEAATRAVAAALGGRSVPAATADQPAGATAEQVKHLKLERAPAAPPVVLPGSAADTGEPNTAQVVAPAAQSAGTPSSREQVAVVQETRERTVPSSAPVLSGPPERTADDRGEQAAQVGSTASDPVALPEQITSVAPSSKNPVQQPAKEVATAAQEQRRSVTPPSPRLALTASINHAQSRSMPEAPAGRARHMSMANAAARPERPAAPWSGVEQVGFHTQTTRLQEKPAAPRSAGQDRNDTGGGTVMLDGRLVGQWLSDHMAREASRPPAGTSFFDPRQTPAWTVSGAL